MTVGYHQRCDGSLVPDYACQGEGIAHGRAPCQNVCGSGVDAAVAALILGELTPFAIEAAFEVSAELARRTADADRIRQAGVERARQDESAAGVYQRARGPRVFRDAGFRARTYRGGHGGQRRRGLHL